MTRDLQTMFSEFYSSEDDFSKAAALEPLILRGRKTNTHLLLDSFRDQTEYTQASIIFAMRWIANARAKRILVNLMSEEWLTISVRAALTDVIRSLGLSQCKPIVQKQLQHTAPEIRFWSCTALGMMGNADDLEQLQALLGDNAIGWEKETVAQAARGAIDWIRLGE